MHQLQMRTSPALTLEMPKDNHKREREQQQTEECETRDTDHDTEIGISTDYLRSLERQLKNDKK